MIDPRNPGASHLNHLGVFYAAAIAELGRGHALGAIPHDAPGMALVRDLLQLVLFQRAELNALTKVLSEAGVLDLVTFGQQCQDEYEWLANGKAKSIGDALGIDIQITDYGVSIGPRRS